MAFALVPDELWHEIEPLLPVERPKPKGGRPAVPNRQALAGIVYVLRSGVAWNMVPAELGCGSGVTCWRRLRDWTQAGVWAEVHRRLLRQLGKADALDLSLAVIDSQSVRAVFGGTTQGRTPLTEGRMAANGM